MKDMNATEIPPHQPFEPTTLKQLEEEMPPLTEDILEDSEKMAEAISD